MVERTIGELTAVPYDTVTVNGHYMRRLNERDEPYDHHWALIAPNGRAIDDEDGRPYLYRDFGKASEDAGNLAEMGEYSTCR